MEAATHTELLLLTRQPLPPVDIRPAHLARLTILPPPPTPRPPLWILQATNLPAVAATILCTDPVLLRVSLHPGGLKEHVHH